MGLNAIKCEGYSNVGKCEFGKETVSASDLGGTDLLKGLALVAAAGVGIAVYHHMSAQSAETGYVPKIKNENLTADFPNTAKADETIVAPPATITDAGNGSNGTAPQSVAEPEQKYDIRSDPQFEGMRFKEIYYVVSPTAAKQYGGIEEFDKSLEPYAKDMSGLFKHFDAGVAIEFRNAGVADPTDHGVKQVLEELNSKYGCSYLREQNKPAKDAIFAWFLDEKTWNEHAWDFGTEKIGVGWTELGFVIKIPSGTAGMPYPPSFLAHEFSHVFGIGDRDSGGDKDELMYRLDIPWEPSTFGDASKIKFNLDRKLNTC